jgi:hypothetical protein
LGVHRDARTPYNTHPQFVVAEVLTQLAGYAAKVLSTRSDTHGAVSTSDDHTTATRLSAHLQADFAGAVVVKEPERLVKQTAHRHRHCKAAWAERRQRYLGELLIGIAGKKLLRHCTSQARA